MDNMQLGKISTIPLSVVTLLSAVSLVNIDFCSSQRTKIYSVKLRTVQETDSDYTEDVGERRRRSVAFTDNPHVKWTPAKNNLRGKADQGYYIEMGLGTPTQKLHVLVDTGSSNFAVAAASHPFISTYFHTNESSTYKDLNRKVMVPYTQGEWDGELCQDMSRIVSGPDVAVMANIAGITHSEEFFSNGSKWQGILGLGYAEIARPDNTLEPFFDTLVRDGHVEDIFALQLCGSNKTISAEPEDTDVSGTMTVGGVDKSLYNGTMWYSPMLKEGFYEVVIVDMEVDSESLEMDCKEYNFDKTIVDSGTTNLRLPKAVFNKVNRRISKQMPGNFAIRPEFFTGDQLLCKHGPIEPWEWFPTIGIALQGRQDGQAFKLVISPKQYLRSVNSDRENCYKYGVSSSDTGAVIGAVVMEGLYVVFDRQNKSVGFAMSSCAEEDFLPNAPDIIGPLYINSTDCAYNAVPPDNQILLIVAYIMACLCILCLLVPVIFLAVHWQMEKCRKEPADVPEDGGLLQPQESDS